MEQKRLDKKNLIVLAVVLVLIAAAAVTAIVMRKPLAPVTEDTKAYLVIEVAGEMYEPIPLEEDGRYTITRGEMVNEIAVTRDSVTMHASTCENQDCVNMGEVTLDNLELRVMGGFIICLPHKVSVEVRE